MKYLLGLILVFLMTSCDVVYTEPQPYMPVVVTHRYYYTNPYPQAYYYNVHPYPRYHRPTPPPPPQGYRRPHRR